jgi:hypothetical protein
MVVCGSDVLALGAYPSFISKNLTIINIFFLVEGAYASGSRIEFPEKYREYRE